MGAQAERGEKARPAVPGRHCRVVRRAGHKEAGRQVEARGRSRCRGPARLEGEASAHWEQQRGLSLKYAPPGRPSRRPPPALRQPHPSVREAALNQTAGIWALSGHRAKSGLHTAPGLHVGTAPQGPGGLGSVVAASPAPTGCHCQVHRGSVCSRREGPVFAHPPLPYTRPDRSRRGGRGPGWDEGEPRFTGPNAARRQGPVCSRTTGDVSPCFRGRGGPAREHRPQAQPSGHHGPRAWLSSPRAGGRARHTLG